MGGANHFNEYYEKNGEVKGYWIGNACELCGVKVSEEVSEVAFEALRTNHHAVTGKQITCRHNTVRKEASGKIVSNRRSFYDCVFSSPKSFSVLGVTCGNERVRAWHDFAVRYTLKEMERWTARQDHKNPESSVEITGKFVAAWYKHDVSRASEPNLHDHIIIFNMTLSKNGRSYAIEAKTFYDRSRYFTAIYRDKLASQAIDAGCYVEYDTFGAPQICLKEKSLKSICDHFSSRAGIRTYLAKKCEKLIGSSLTNNEITMLIRHSRGLKRDIFDERFAKESFSGSRYKILKNFCDLLKNCSDGGLVQATTKEVLDAQKKSLSQEYLKLLDEVQLTIGSKIKKENECFPFLVDAFKTAVRQCLEKKSAVFDYELFEIVLRSCCGKGVHPNQLEGVLKELTESDKNELVKIGDEVTTVSYLKKKQDLIRWVSESKGFLKEPESIRNTTLANTLNAQVSKSVLETIHSGDQFKVIVGKPGIEKTFVLLEIVRIYVENNKKVFVFAPSNGARNVVRKGGEKMESIATSKPFLKSESLQMLLLKESMQQEISKGSLVILDEAGLASFEQMHAFLGMAFQKKWNVQLCGDFRQHTGTEASDALRILLCSTTIHRVRLDTPVSQVGLEAQEKRAQRSKLKEISNIQTTEAFENRQLKSQKADDCLTIPPPISPRDSLTKMRL